MTISMKGVVLFVVVQISVVLCASTGKPSEKDLEGLFGGISAGVVQDGNAVQVAAIIPKSKVIVTGATYETEIPQDGTVVQLGATIPSKMSFDEYTYRDYYEYESSLTVFTIVAIIISVFVVLSFILGCILYFCCKKEPRRGYVVNYSGGPVSVMPQPSISQPGFVNPMHQSSMSQPSMSQPGFVQPNQQQNIYPSVQASKE